jgi:hypothetical protein
MRTNTIAFSFVMGVIVLFVAASQGVCQTQPKADLAAKSASAGAVRSSADDVALMYGDVLGISSLASGSRSKLKETFKGIEAKMHPVEEELQSLRQQYPGGRNAPPDAVKKYKQLQEKRQQIIQEWMSALQANLTPAQMSEASALREKRLSSRAVGNAGQQAAMIQTAMKQTVVDMDNFRPLTELQVKKYKNFEGGLYSSGKNTRPAEHELAGLRLSKTIAPLDKNGIPSKDGRIVFMSIGMSNCTQEFSAFKQMVEVDKEKNPKLLLVDAAQGGMAAQNICKLGDNGSATRYWTVVDEVLKIANSSREQVQVVWLKEADSNPTLAFPGGAQRLEKELADIVRIISKRFIHVKLCYISSRSYGGYAISSDGSILSTLNPEPYAYESGFAVKWLIENQVRGNPLLNFDSHHGTIEAPWLSWGPYLWANGTRKRADGLSYDRSDFGSDGTHPSPSGRKKIAALLLQFFKTDSTTKSWFCK